MSNDPIYLSEAVEKFLGKSGDLAKLAAGIKLKPASVRREPLPEDWKGHRVIVTPASKGYQKYIDLRKGLIEALIEGINSQKWVVSGRIGNQRETILGEYIASFSANRISLTSNIIGPFSDVRLDVYVPSRDDKIIEEIEGICRSCVPKQPGSRYEDIYHKVFAIIGGLEIGEFKKAWKKADIDPAYRKPGPPFRLGKDEQV
ncbi:hypothetical protein FSZ31_12045 [Sphingorhabdus soli]|uniref:Uncharacterized protein n=1 Tax=Flavisphingopyxis soli TaxID=2601267 RepID=A0A5C6U4G2_9SPHN|nr:hypothetical protein [Sphingorhabdus soli]TXC67709.1 hypothetical protein FSZ31_12045 [Sphingorhabdus soli]